MSKRRKNDLLVAGKTGKYYRVLLEISQLHESLRFAELHDEPPAKSVAEWSETKVVSIYIFVQRLASLDEEYPETRCP